MQGLLCLLVGHMPSSVKLLLLALVLQRHCCLAALQAQLLPPVLLLWQPWLCGC
jgi:hypothetical protein